MSFRLVGKLYGTKSISRILISSLVVALGVVSSQNSASAADNVSQWATTASATSEHPAGYFATQATGAPDADDCNNNGVWAPRYSDEIDSLALTYTTSVVPTSINVYQNNVKGAVSNVEVSADGNTWTSVYIGDVSAPSYGTCDESTQFDDILTVTVSSVQTEINHVRVTVEGTNAPNRPAIDAVQLVGSPAAPPAPSPSASSSHSGSCADGGDCVIGDTGPGGGVVFFVKGTGSFDASAVATCPFSSQGECSMMWQSSSIIVHMSAEMQAALPFDYMEVAPASGLVSRPWSSADWSGGTTEPRIGAGSAGTDAIKAAYPDDTQANNAAYYASAYSNNGKSDWFLPSTDELAVAAIRHANGELGANDPFSAAQIPGNNDAGVFYGWTTDTSQSNVVKIYPGFMHKNWSLTSGYHVLPVRAFSATSDSVDPTPTPTPTPSSSSTSTPTATQTKTVVSRSSATFAASSSVLTTAGKKAIKKIVKKSGKDAHYTVTGIAGKSIGLSNAKVRALAKARADKVRNYLIKLGVKKSHIKLKIKVVESGVTPKTKILAKYVTN